MGAQVGGGGKTLGAGRRARFALPTLACFALLAFAPPALATFHEISIREVYPGGTNDASYVELQMWTGGQNFVGTHHLVAYDADGSVSENFSLPSDVSSGANQATILVADTSYPVVFDEKPAPDASDGSLNLSPAGGAVCWIEGAPPDCVAWGNFTGPLPSHLPELKVGSPASPGSETSEPPFVSPAQVAPSSSAKRWVSASPGRVRANTPTTIHIAAPIEKMASVTGLSRA